jgi:peptide/nickel transport system permease protein
MLHAIRRHRGLQLSILLLLPFFIAAVYPSLIAPYGSEEILDAPLLPPSSDYLLGTDEIGRDIFSRLVYAAHTDLLISLAATAIALLLAWPTGLVAGYLGGIAGGTLMRISDIMLAFPSILLALFLITVFGRGTLIIILALTLLYIPAGWRLARGLATGLRERGFVEASVIAGAGPFHVMRKHLLPNTLAPFLVAFALTAAYSLLAASTLSYLGVGTQPPTPSWGNMLRTSFDWVYQAPLYGITSGACIVLVALGYTWLSDAVQDVTGGRVYGTRVRTMRALTERATVGAPPATPGDA